MGSGEKFCLRWNDFEANVSVALKELREDEDFFDVTLACEDDQINAHKLILSACSPFFRTILRRNKHEHPLLFLRGVKYKDLVSILNFMYHGEVNVAQEELNAFLSVAEDLQVKGLTQNDKDTKKSHSSRKKTLITDNGGNKANQKCGQTLLDSIKQKKIDDEDIVEIEPVKNEPQSNSNQVSAIEEMYQDNHSTLYSEENLAVDHMRFDDQSGYDDYTDCNGEHYFDSNIATDDGNKGKLIFSFFQLKPV